MSRISIRSLLLLLVLGVQFALLQVQLHTADASSLPWRAAVSVLCAGCVLALGWPLLRDRGHAS